MKKSDYSFTHIPSFEFWAEDMSYRWEKRTGREQMARSQEGTTTELLNALTFSGWI